MAKRRLKVVKMYERGGYCRHASAKDAVETALKFCKKEKITEAVVLFRDSGGDDHIFRAGDPEKIENMLHTAAIKDALDMYQ